MAIKDEITRIEGAKEQICAFVQQLTTEVANRKLDECGEFLAGCAPVRFYTSTTTPDQYFNGEVPNGLALFFQYEGE